MKPSTDADDRDASRPTVGHWGADDCDVYAGRGYDGESLADLGDEIAIGERGWLGNPFIEGEDGDRETVISKFAVAFCEVLSSNDEFRAAVRELEGDTLGCWCRRVDHPDGDRCHGDVIANAVEALNAE